MSFPRGALMLLLAVSTAVRPHLCGRALPFPLGVDTGARWQWHVQLSEEQPAFVHSGGTVAAQQWTRVPTTPPPLLHDYCLLLTQRPRWCEVVARPTSW